MRHRKDLEGRIWQIASDLPNLPKFSATQYSHYSYSKFFVTLPSKDIERIEVIILQTKVSVGDRQIIMRCEVFVRKVIRF